MAEPNRKKYIEILQKMTGEERVRIAFELFEFAKDIMIEGIKAQNPGITPEEIQKEVVRRDDAMSQEEFLDTVVQIPNQLNI